MAFDFTPEWSGKFMIPHLLLHIDANLSLLLLLLLTAFGIITLFFFVNWEFERYSFCTELWHEQIVMDNKPHIHFLKLHRSPQLNVLLTNLMLNLHNNLAFFTDFDAGEQHLICMSVNKIGFAHSSKSYIL